VAVRYTNPALSVCGSAVTRVWCLMRAVGGIVLSCSRSVRPARVDKPGRSTRRKLSEFRMLGASSRRFVRNIAATSSSPF
jgi:hypothetical protein